MRIVRLKDELVVRGVYSIFYQEKERDFLLPGQKDDSWGLIYMTRGHAYLLTDDKECRINQGEVLLFNRNQNYVLWSDSRTPPFFLTISFDMQFVNDDFFRFRKFKANGEIDSMLEKITSERLNMFEGSMNSEALIKKKKYIKCSEQLLKIYLTELLLILYRCSDKSLPDVSVRSSAIRQKSEGWVFDKCVNYIEAHIFERIYPEDVCRSVCISLSYANKIFRDMTDLSIMDYVNHAKLEKAKELLRESKLKVSQISELLGFSSIHYFSNRFKLKYSVSPKEYSKSIKTSA